MSFVSKTVLGITYASTGLNLDQNGNGASGHLNCLGNVEPESRYQNITYPVLWTRDSNKD